MSVVAPRVVVVTRPTPYEALVARHGTREQARFFLGTRQQGIEGLEAQHARVLAARQAVSAAIPLKWRRSLLDRSDLSRFLFEPGDVLVAVGQDGLVANLAKYLEGQPVLGVNPDPAEYEGVLVRHAPGDVAPLLQAVVAGGARGQQRTMVEAELDDGQRLLALNEVFVGHRTHQSARYRLRTRAAEARHSSSGVIVASGTGATGWARSVHRQHRSAIPLPAPEDPSLAFFAREPFPSVSTSTDLEEGTLAAGESLEIVSEMDEDGTVFGDGIEGDRLPFPCGMSVRVRIAPVRLNLVIG
jgi:hypothetical protein